MTLIILDHSSQFLIYKKRVNQEGQNSHIKNHLVRRCRNQYSLEHLEQGYLLRLISIFYLSEDRQMSPIGYMGHTHDIAYI